MRKFILLVSLAIAVSLLTGCSGDGNTYALIETNMGDVKVLLYNETPGHKDNFVKLANEEFYNGTLFHRVIPNFMIQGGDPQSKGAAPGTMLGGGGPGYMIDNEIGAPHLRGTLAAARNNNPAKQSSGSQFYIVTGQPQSAASLDQTERMKGIKYNETQREAYMTKGGRPDLDQEYTVFGEVVSGMEVVDQISATATAAQNRPTEDVVIERVSIVR